MLKGDKLASGKDLVMESAMKHFLKEHSSHRVVHVSLNAVRAEKIANMPDISDEEKNRMAIICADEYTTGDCE